MKIKIGLIIITILFSLCTILSAQIKLPKLISDGMVLQRNTTLKIWGWASTNETVNINFKGEIYTTVADTEGNWHVKIPAQKAGGSYEMKIKGKNEITIHDILIGDVWICSGQSNMELMMDRVKYKYAAEIASANNSNIRQFTVPDKYNFINQEKDLVAGTWVNASAKNIREFSAVAYFFAKELYAKYKIPIGLINAALGGSPAEAWISEDALVKFPDYYQAIQKFKNIELIKNIELNNSNVNSKWYKELNEADSGLKNNWRSELINDSDWKQMDVPGYWADTETGNINGSVWFRKKITITRAMAESPVKLELGRIVDADSVFINGQLIGATSYQYPPRRYALLPGILKEGENNIAIRIINNSGRGGFVMDKPYELTNTTDTINLSGNWKYKIGAVMNALPSQTTIRWQPAGLYNAMIAPLLDVAMKGVIWYQGESNADRPKDYVLLMQTLITDWRTKWNQGNFPFIYVQLPNFMEAQTTPQESTWAELRQQQLNTLSVPNTAMVVAIDLGEWNDIHPQNKKDIGIRLALQAKKMAYKEKAIVASGPLYKSMKIQGNKIIIQFTNTGSGLMAKGNSELNHFAIAGKDKKFYWAKATINHSSVTVWNNSVIEPIVVRYAWANNPKSANLYNKEGLPASPFSTIK